MPQKPIPLRTLDRRMPQAGRIRSGHKVPTADGKDRPNALRTFRFTSKDQQSLVRVAELYGGDVKAWHDPLSPDRWEVYTEASEINVALPPGDPLGGTPIYEMWTKGGNQRRCDGETCTLAQGAGPEGADPMEVPCLCAKRGLECKLTTRLSVILPDVRFLGTWRIDSKGRNAAEELPGMVAGVQATEAAGIVRAILRLDHRVEMHRGKKREFVVPTLGVDATPEELAAGSVRLGLQGGAYTAALEPAAVDRCPGCESPYSLHRLGCPNELVLRDAVVVDVKEAGVVDPENVQAWLDTLTQTQQNKVLGKARKKAEERGMDVPNRFEEITVELADMVMANGTP